MYLPRWQLLLATISEPDLQTQVHNDPATQTEILATLDTSVRGVLNLSNQQVADLIAFLEALTDPKALDLSQQIPATVPSGLPIDR